MSKKEKKEGRYIRSGTFGSGSDVEKRAPWDKGKKKKPPKETY
tara:strand:+ start:471 stop:599 length:129 start_codon:yes stop_codon:yes gene_type:complete